MNTKTSPRRLLIEKALLLLDLLMIILVCINLSLISFEWLYSSVQVKTFLAMNFSSFQIWYETTIHANFVSIDLIFISAYLLEFSFSWLVAINQRTYERWFIYPIAHWYDLLGCIPADAFRFMRILRFISLALRLHRAGLIDINKLYVIRQIRWIFAIFSEEITDRVIVNIISSTQKDISQGNPVLQEINNTVVRKRQQELSSWADQQLGTHLLTALTKNEEAFKAYLTEIGQHALLGSASKQSPLLARKFSQLFPSSYMKP